MSFNLATQHRRSIKFQGRYNMTSIIHPLIVRFRQEEIRVDPLTEINRTLYQIQS